ncbi:hypothetical protein Tco_0444741 [Tanacetum coccineum]
METTDKGNTDKDCINDSNSAMSKGTYVPVCKKYNPNMYSPVPVTRCVLRLANVTTWDEIEKKMGAKKSKTCADKAKGKRKKPPIFYDDDDDDDEESSIPLKDIISELPLSIAITPDFLITDSLIMEDEHLDTILETESDEENESSVEDLNLTPSESEDLSDIKKEFSGELAPIDLISTEIDEADFDPDEEIRLVEKLFDSLMEEIDIFLAPDDSIPPSIENDDYDSEGDILFLEELLSNDSLSLPENESFHFDRYYDPSSPRPPSKPPMMMELL